MEDLNKNQFILLVLLITFVTSIATGIMTTSLLQEAPVEITRNINRIVEKTIETVTTATPVAPGQKEVTTVVVKEEDLIVDSINKNIKSVVRLKEKDSILGTTSFYGMGLVVNKEGAVIADRKTITSANTYTVVMSDGKEFILTPVGVDKQTNFILFKPIIPEKDPKSTDKTSYTFTPATFSDADPKLGQTIISLGGQTEDGVAVGRIISLQTKESGTGTSTIKYISKINTDVSSKDLVDGSPVFNLSGDLIGVKLSQDELKTFTPVSILKNELNSLSEPPKSTQ